MFTKRDYEPDMGKIIPVILAGGSGTRLWPLSRKSYPKQFSNILKEHTLFQACAERLTSSGSVQFASHITLTNSDFRFIVVEQLQDIGIDPGPILIEPEPKNTAAAILAACIYSHQQNEDAVLIVAPSDHIMPEKLEFHESIKVGYSYTQQGKIVTFGIKPTHPETGYGYLQLSANAIDSCSTSSLVKFIEKPSLQHAEEMLATDNYLWNAGIFMFRASDMIRAFKAYSPDTLELVIQAVAGATTDLGFLRLSNQSWSRIEAESIDYEIMEKANNIVVVPYNSKWSDLGDWDAVWAQIGPDASGNVTSETAHAIECANCLLRTESDSQQLVGIGLDNIIAIAMPDAVLVAQKDRSQDVRKAVEILKASDISQAQIFPKDHRPWGWFESLALGDLFQVKRIFVKPGAALSLQSHMHRSEHWIVVEGTAKVTINEEIKYVFEGQSVYVPLGSKHRMENDSDTPMVLIEVQIGTYFGEDDIIRYEDKYHRLNK